MILLDTDVMVDLLRQYQPAVVWLPGFVVMELIQGCRNRVEQNKLERELRAYGVAWPSPETCEEALSVFARYYLSHGLGIIDVLIGQMAVALNVPLYTFNQKHYAVIPNLKTVQPYEKSAQE